MKYGLTVQPFGVIIGDLSSPQFIIVVDDIKYCIETGIRALELLFKLFHAFDIDYPQECTAVWKFLEKAVFQMKGSMCPTAASVYADISYHLKNISSPNI